MKKIIFIIVILALISAGSITNAGKPITRTPKATKVQIGKQNHTAKHRVKNKGIAVGIVNKTRWSPVIGNSN